MGVSDNNFMELSKEVTKDFLQTAVFVDEQAYFEKEEAVTELVTPTRSIQKDETDIPSAEISEEANHTLNAKEVIDVFASEGIVCSVIKPLKEEKITSDGMINAVKKADALILDWDIHSDEGETALDIINYIISCDIDSRLRLILIYSGEKLSEISKSVSESLGKIGFNNPDDFTFIKGHSRISIYAKTVGSDTSSDNSRTLEIEDIPNCLASELSQMTAGLISNVALKSMSVLRKNTHLILAKLGPEIDPPYLSHRCLLPYPEDAKGHIVDIIADELHCLLNNSEVTDLADLDSIKKWLNYVNRDERYCIYHSDGNTPYKTGINYNQIINLLEKGYDKTKKSIKYDNDEGQNKSLNDKGFRQLSKTFDFIDGHSHDKDCQFAIITSQKSHYVDGSNIPILTQGSILKGSIDGSPSEYWLCIQQKCDCVRLGKETEFSFVPLKNIEGNKAFDLVVQDQDSYVKLRIDYDNHESWLFTFKPAEGVVRATCDEVQFIFKTHDENNGGNEFRLISELKENHIQRISNNIATKLSRIGLDESEWQRRWSGSN